MVKSVLSLKKNGGFGEKYCNAKKSGRKEIKGSFPICSAQSKSANNIAKSKLHQQLIK